MTRPSREFQGFRDLTDRLLSTPRAVVQKRLTKHREAAAQNPNKRGPKPKLKTTEPSASGHEED